jgi:hypothetical protein
MYYTRDDIEYRGNQIYRLKGSDKKWKGVGYSTIYRHGKEDWTKKIPKKTLDSARARGTNFDDCLREYYENQVCSLSCRNLFTSTGKILDSLDIEAQEVFLHANLDGCDIVGYADAIATVTQDLGINLKSNRVIIDWKTKARSRYNPIHLTSYLVQASVYSRMAHKFYGDLFTDCLIVLAFQDGSPAHLIHIDMATMGSCYSEFREQIKRYLADSSSTLRLS